MPDNTGKPEVINSEVTATPGSVTQPQEATPAANPEVVMSDSVKSYLKGLGLEGVNATPELVKVAEAGMKQKESVSKKSLEVEQLMAKLASQGKDVSISEEAPQETTPTPEPQDVAGHTTGVSDNDLFDLARIITTDFKEIASEAEDGSLFRELRQLGYFTSKGIDKKAVYSYLQARNSQAQELRELREFKEKYSQPNPANNPVYNQTPGYNPNAAMSKAMAENIVMSGDHSNPRYAESLEFLRKDALSRHSF